VSKGEQTRQAIIERATIKAGELGLEGVTLGTLADELQLSKSGLFAHFKSKETLQLAVIDRVTTQFADQVVRPAIALPRGEPRVRALADRYIVWIADVGERGGCMFMALSYEYDDRPGPIRDRLVAGQRDWLATIARAATIAVAEGHFRDDLDTAQFAFEFEGIGMSFHISNRLLADPTARDKAAATFDALITRSRAS
jgi:AcrR family transcriptional regulator